MAELGAQFKVALTVLPVFAGIPTARFKVLICLMDETVILIKFFDLSWVKPGAMMRGVWLMEPGDLISEIQFREG